ncbi:MAG TPA: phosphoribosylanthranilate isomerase [Chondromyces sp.]|nr:phosphoribosylanthranilate isomerase [Chondromyces sp.]
MKVKICGIQDMASAKHAVEIGADAIGFVFAPSKRRVTEAQAAGITKELPASLLKIGVFVNEELEKVEQIVHTAGLDLVQLHGDEPPDYASRLSVPTIKAFGVNGDRPIREYFDYPADYILLDSPKGVYRGGNGTSFDWELLRDEEIPRERLILAGGLTINNVHEAITLVKPGMVDVSSGVETEGKKDFVKMQSFIENAKGAIKK